MAQQQPIRAVVSPTGDVLNLQTDHQYQQDSMMRQHQYQQQVHTDSTPTALQAD
jgi:hypothetical protein